MRIHIRCISNGELIPFNYHPMVTGAMHKWIGKNEIHDDVSLYSFSWLMGGTASKEGLRFNDGARFFISSFDREVLKRIIGGIQSDPSIGHGLSVSEVILQEEPAFQTEASFFCASPVLVKRRVNEKEVHYTFDNEESDKYLTETLKTKLKKAGLSDEGVMVKFDRDYRAPRIKVIYYNKVGNKVNLCPVKITGTSEQIAFAWNVGVGNSTGIGFGALK